MRAAWAVAGLATGGLLASCVDLRAFQCSRDEDCVNMTSRGWCEDSRYCSYPDIECPSRRRFSDLAGPFAGRCTSDELAMGSSSSPSEPNSSSLDPTGTTPGVDGSGPSTSGGSAGSACGNGVVEADEECDELDAIDGDGCNTDCVAGGSVRWSGVVASEEGGDDRLFGLTLLASGDVVGAGFYASSESRDVLLSRWTVDGSESGRVIHDVSGGADSAEAIVQGGTGRLFVCGRAIVDGIERPWVGRWDAALDAPPLNDGTLFAPEFDLTESCYDLVYLNSNRIVATGGTYSAMGRSTAWAYSFGSGSIDGGSFASVEDDFETRFRGAARSPTGELFLAGQVATVGRIYSPESSTVLGAPLVDTGIEVQLQTIEVTGTSIVAGGLFRDGDGLDDLWVSTYERDGELRWTYAPEEMAIDEIEDLALDPAGNIYAIGHVTAQNDNPDRWVGKLDPAGQLVWERNDYAGAELGDDRGRSIEVLPDGDLIVVGELTTPGGDLDGWIARLAP